MPNQTLIEFQDDLCRVYHWKQARNTYTLQHDLTVPFLKPRTESIASPESSSSQADYLVEAPGADAEKSPIAAPPLLSEEKCAEANTNALKRALKENGLKVESALALVPKHWVTLRVVTLPATDPAEIIEMAQFEAERHIPFNVDRHVIAHRVISSEDIQGSRVLLAALDGPPSEQITKIFNDAGIALEGIEVSTIALVDALLQTGRWNAEQDPTIAHVHIGPGNTDIIILNKGEPIFARSASIGAAAISDSLAQTLRSAASPKPQPAQQVHSLDDSITFPSAFAPPDTVAPGLSDDVLPDPLDASADDARFDLQELRSNRLMREIRRTLDYAHREFECGDFSRIFISGVGAGAQHLEDAFQARFNVTSEILDPFAPAVGASGGPRLKLDPALAKTTSPWAHALAAGALARQLDPAALRINLIPPAYVQARSKARRQRLYITLACVLILALAGGFVATNRTLDHREKQLAALETEIKSHQERAKEIKTRKTVIRILEEATSQEKSALAILDKISEWKPLFTKPSPRVSITEFDYDYVKLKRLKIVGWARDYPDLNAFEANLKATKFFTLVKREKHDKGSSPNSRAQDALNYEFTCSFRSDSSKGGK